MSRVDFKCVWIFEIIHNESKLAIYWYRWISNTPKHQGTKRFYFPTSLPGLDPKKAGRFGCPQQQFLRIHPLLKVHPKLPPAESSARWHEQWKKTRTLFSLDFGCLIIEIRIMFFVYNPHITGQYNPAYTLNNQGFCSLLTWFFVARIGNPKLNPSFWPLLECVLFVSQGQKLYSVNPWGLACGIQWPVV